jgi:tetratricopeptide (TPR) repeat protein
VFWFFLALSVESTLIPLQAINEHRLYLPSMGAITAAVSGAHLLIERPGASAMRKTAVFAALLCLAFMFGAATVTRNQVWKDETSIWEDVVRKAPGNYRGHLNLANAYHHDGLEDLALEHYLRNGELNEQFYNAPSYKSAHFNMGLIYIEKQMFDEARHEFQTTFNMDPAYPGARGFLEFTKDPGKYIGR